MPLSNDKRYSARDFLELIPETSERHELIEGEIVLQAAPNRTHQRIVGGAYSEIRSFIKKMGGICESLIAPFDVVINDRNVVQPDVFVVCDPDKLDEKRCNGAPDLVIVVVSSNRTDDFNRKLKLYWDNGVREYWIIDPSQETVRVYIFKDNTLINIYTFDQPIPVGIYEGELTITVADFI